MLCFVVFHVINWAPKPGAALMLLPNNGMKPLTTNTTAASLVMVRCTERSDSRTNASEQELWRKKLFRCNVALLWKDKRVPQQFWIASDHVGMANKFMAMAV